MDCHNGTSTSKPGFGSMKVSLVAYIVLALLSKACACLQPHKALLVSQLQEFDKESSLCGGCLLICGIAAFPCLEQPISAVLVLAYREGSCDADTKLHGMCCTAVGAYGPASADADSLPSGFCSVLQDCLRSGVAAMHLPS